MRTNRLEVIRLVMLGCVLLAAIMILWSRFYQETSRPQHDLAAVPRAIATSLPPGELPTSQPSVVAATPGAGLTVTPGFSTEVPTPFMLPAPTVVGASQVSRIVPGLSLSFTLKNTLNGMGPVDDLAWAPTGDKLLQVNSSGELYALNADGSNAQYLTTYPSGTTRDLLRDQLPKNNTLIIDHAGQPQGTSGDRDAGYFDVIQFTPGNKPTLKQEREPKIHKPSKQGAGQVSQVTWWGPDRASGRVKSEYEGGDKLVTLDAKGRLVDEKQIPYMFSAVVQPGGEWLAYAASGKETPRGTTSVGNVYLLDLKQNRHLQLAVPSGSAQTVLNWSTDGNWFYVVGYYEDALHGFIVSADGTNQTVVTPPGFSGFDAVWSPDSKYLAYTTQNGGGEHANSTPVPYWSELYIVDVAARTFALLDSSLTDFASSSLFMQPSWSPDGSLISLLSYDPSCPGLCSRSDLIGYVLSVTPGAKK